MVGERIQSTESRIFERSHGVLRMPCFSIGDTSCDVLARCEAEILYNIKHCLVTERRRLTIADCIVREDVFLSHPAFGARCLAVSMIPETRHLAHGRVVAIDAK